MAQLTFDTYGKTGVRLTQVIRESGWHEVLELSANIFFEGGFSEAYTDADNSGVLPTDTIKNTVYALARQSPITSIETFGRTLAQHFLSKLKHLNQVRVEILQTPWLRLGGAGAAFVGGGQERRFASVRATQSECVISAGLRSLEILKTGGSAFVGFLKDPWTTLPETEDRLLGTALDAAWRYRSDEIDFNALHTQVRAALLHAFATHQSASVQHTLFAMAQAALDEIDSLAEVHLVMPNKHRLLADLNKFGLDNPNQIFVPVDEPSGYIEARVTAAQDSR